MAYNWTDESIAKLKDLLAKGMSARQIGEELGGLSRNAVIGKAHRLGLSTQKEKETETATKKVETKTTKLPTPLKPKEKKAREPIHITPHSIQSTDKLCQWPNGDPGTPEFSFCYAEAVAGRPYCIEHCEVAYRRNTD